MSFSDLGLTPSLCHPLAQRGYKEPTPVQSASIPVVLDGADLIARAHTGTGKTAAFGLPMIERLLCGSPSADARPARPRARAHPRAGGSRSTVRCCSTVRPSICGRSRSLEASTWAPRCRPFVAAPISSWRRPAGYRSYGAQDHRPGRRGDPGARRRRSHARHGFHARAEAPSSRCRRPAVADVLRDLLTRPVLAANSRATPAGGPGGRDGCGHCRASRAPRGARAETRAAGPSPAPGAGARRSSSARRSTGPTRSATTSRAPA